MIPGCSLNWARTSWMTTNAALPTALMARPEKKNGHSSVPSVTVTFRGAGVPERKALLVGSSHYKDGDLYSPFRFAYTEAGRTTAQAWWDTIAVIKETSDEGATVVFKSGESRAVRFGKEGHRYLLVHTPEVAALTRIRPASSCSVTASAAVRSRVNTAAASP